MSTPVIALTAQMGNLTTILQTLQATMSRAAGGVGRMSMPAMGPLQKKEWKMPWDMDKFGTMIKDSFDVTTLGKGVGKIGGVMGKVGGVMGKGLNLATGGVAGAVGKGMVGALGALGPQMLALELAVKPVTAFLNGILQQFQPIIDIFGAFGEILGMLLMPIIEELMKFLLPLMPVLMEIVTAFTPIVSLIALPLALLADAMVIVAPLLTGAISAISWVTEFIQRLVDWIETFFDNITSVAKDAVDNMIDSIRDWFGGVWDDLSDWFDDFKLW